MAEINADASRSKLVSLVEAWGTPRPDPAAPFRPLSSLPLNAGRFNYFHIEVINPYWPDPQNAGLFEPSSEDADLAAHKWQEQKYRTMFDSGKRKALEQYAHVDPDAFESVWFRAEIKRLRLARKSAQLERIFTAYRARQGKRGVSKLLQNIERDQRVFRRVSDGRKRSEQLKHRRVPLWRIMQDVGESECPHLTIESVKEIDREYRRYYERVVPDPLSHDEFFSHLSDLLIRMQNAVSEKCS